MSDKDMVKFLMPDGTEVSNDPRFGLQEALQKSLESTPNTGNAGIPQAEFEAQHQVMHESKLNSGQPGVGPNATLEDPTGELHGVLGSPAQQRQKEDAQKAAEDGASPQNTSVDDPDPVDSNEKVLEVREAVEKARKQALKAATKRAEAEEEPGDGDKPYTEWSSKQLVEELTKRNAARAETGQDAIEVEGRKTIASVAAALTADDEASAESDEDEAEDDTEDDEES